MPTYLDLAMAGKPDGQGMVKSGEGVITIPPWQRLEHIGQRQIDFVECLGAVGEPARLHRLRRRERGAEAVGAAVRRLLIKALQQIAVRSAPGVIERESFHPHRPAGWAADSLERELMAASLRLAGRHGDAKRKKQAKTQKATLPGGWRASGAVKIGCGVGIHGVDSAIP